MKSWNMRHIENLIHLFLKAWAVWENVNEAVYRELTCMLQPLRNTSRMWRRAKEAMENKFKAAEEKGEEQKQVV